MYATYRFIFLQISAQKEQIYSCKLIRCNTDWTELKLFCQSNLVDHVKSSISHRSAVTKVIGVTINCPCGVLHHFYHELELMTISCWSDINQPYIHSFCYDHKSSQKCLLKGLKFSIHWKIHFTHPATDPSPCPLCLEIATVRANGDEDFVLLPLPPVTVVVPRVAATTCQSSIRPCLRLYWIPCL